MWVLMPNFNWYNLYSLLKKQQQQQLKLDYLLISLLSTLYQAAAYDEPVCTLSLKLIMPGRFNVIIMTG